MRRFLGQFSFYLERLQGYAAKLNFLMILYLFIGESKIEWYWFLLMIPGGLFLAWFDAKYVLPEYLGEFMRQNPEWRKQFSEKDKKQ